MKCTQQTENISKNTRTPTASPTQKEKKKKVKQIDTRVLARAIYKRSIYDPINEALKEPISRSLNEATHQQWGGLIIIITNHHNLAATPIINY